MHSHSSTTNIYVYIIVYMFSFKAPHDSVVAVYYDQHFLHRIYKHKLNRATQPTSIALRILMSALYTVYYTKIVVGYSCVATRFLDVLYTISTFTKCVVCV